MWGSGKQSAPFLRRMKAWVFRVRETGIGGVISGAGVRVATEAKSWDWRWRHTPVLFSGSQGWEGSVPEGMAAKVGRSQHIGLGSFEVPEQTCFAWNHCSPQLVLWYSSVHCPASSLFHTLRRIMVRSQCPPPAIFCVALCLGWW